MFYIYVDEAGTSAKEPVTVVVGVIVHADTHWRRAKAELDSILNFFVPKDLRNGFVFHAKDVWAGYRSHDGVWSKEQRREFIQTVASIPRRLDMAISLGKVRRDAPPITLDEKLAKAIKPHDFQHVVAFHGCVARANKFVRDRSIDNEVATVVAEDVPHMRRFLRRTLAVHYELPPEKLNVTAFEAATGKLTQTNAGPIDRIVDTIHFVEKDGAPLLQIADACAFSFRRYFAEQPDGGLLVRAMLGGGLVWEDWQGPISTMAFYFSPHRDQIFKV